MRRRTCWRLGVVLLILAIAAPTRAEDAPVGWASVDRETTGGQGGTTVTVSSASALVARAQSAPPLIIRVTGAINLASPLRVKSNKTIVGVGSDAAIRGGGVRIANANNIIIRNLAISQCDPDDAISIEAAAHHIWVDHCDLSACSDELISIKQGSDFITVSWNHFHDHHKTCLLGHSDDANARRIDRGHLRVTYHHNFFDGSQTWHPRVRFADRVHVFNNYFKNNQSGVAAVMDAGVLVEGNVFENVPQPTHTLYGTSPEPGRLVERDNLYIKSGKPQARGTVAEPSSAYRYERDKAEDVARIVGQGAGVGRIEIP